MRKLIAVSLLFAAPLFAAETKKKTPTHVVIAPDAIQWADAPPVLPPGAKMAVLEGNPEKEGIFVVRVKFPDGYRVAPHWHPTRERVNVISGTLHIGMGDTFDASKGETLPTGAFAYMNPKMHHYAWSEGPTEIQIMAMGPLKVIYVNPKDDPSKAGAKGTK